MRLGRIERDEQRQARRGRRARGKRRAKRRDVADPLTFAMPRPSRARPSPPAPRERLPARTTRSGRSPRAHRQVRRAARPPTVASTFGLIRSEPSPSSATTWRSGRWSAMPSASGMAALIESHSAKTGTARSCAAASARWRPGRRRARRAASASRPARPAAACARSREILAADQQHEGPARLHGRTRRRCLTWAARSPRRSACA